MTPILLAVATLALGAGWVMHRMSWVPTDALLRAEAEKQAPSAIDDVRVGRFVRIDGVVVGPAAGTWLVAPMTGVSCVAYSVVASPIVPLEQAVDFVVDVGGAHARVVGRALQLETRGTPIARSHAAMKVWLEERHAASTVSGGVERALRAGSRVTIVSFASGREPDPDRRPDTDGYRGTAQPTRVVLRGRGASTLVLDPLS